MDSSHLHSYRTRAFDRTTYNLEMYLKEIFVKPELWAATSQFDGQDGLAACKCGI